MNIKNSGLDLTNYELWYQPFWKTNIFYFSLFIFLLAFFIVILVLLYKKKIWKKKQLSDIETFCYKIDLLNGNKTKNVRKFYTELILILKEYLSSKFKYNFIKDTDEEMINSLRNFDFPADVISKLVPILIRAKMGKFANNEINETQMMDDLSVLRSVISSFESSKTI